MILDRHEFVGKNITDGGRMKSYKLIRILPRAHHAVKLQSDMAQGTFYS